MTKTEPGDRFAPYQPPLEQSEPVETDWRDRITPKHFAMAAYGCVLLLLVGPLVLILGITLLTRLFTIASG